MTEHEKRQKAIDGLRFTMNMIVFNPLTGETKDPATLNEADKTTYDACLFAIELLEIDRKLEDEAIGHEKREKVVKGLKWMAETYIGFVSDIAEDALILLKSQKQKHFTKEQLEEFMHAHGICNVDLDYEVRGDVMLDIVNDLLDEGYLLNETSKAQEPRKVENIAEVVEDILCGECPNCHRTIVQRESDPTRFCKFCGQEVKWND